MKDILFPCGESENWQASVNQKGGTPAQANSIQLEIGDNFAPKLIEAYTIDNQNVLMVFDEKLDSISVANAIINLNNNVLVDSVFFNTNAPKEIRLKLKNILVANQTYQVSIKNVQDCTGNTLANEAVASFVMPDIAVKGDILLSEVLFNPSTGGVDFVEIYNASEKYIDLKNWALANAEGEVIGNIKKLTINSLIVSPESFLAFTPDIEQLKEQYPTRTSTNWRKTSLPSYNDDFGTVILLDNTENLMQRFDYTEDMHFDLLDDEEGVSLERISFEVDENDANNWTSASSEAGFATPGELNSQNADNPINQLGNDCIKVEPAAFSPDGDGFKDFATIIYGCNNGNKIANVLIYDATGREVRNLRQNATLSNEGFFRWEGTDNSGQKVRVGLYVVFIQLFDLNGNVNEYKLPVAVGGRF
jgi:hypothetical protein